MNIEHKNYSITADKKRLSTENCAKLSLNDFKSLFEYYIIFFEHEKWPEKNLDFLYATA